MNMKKTILIVDDEISIRFILESTLKENFSVISFENGKEALQYLQKGNIPDLVICDLQMPEMNGFSFIKTLKQSGFFEDIPIIVLSGIEESSEKIICFSLGVDDYIIKPFNPEEILARIQRRIHSRDNILNRLGY